MNKSVSLLLLASALTACGGAGLENSSSSLSSSSASASSRSASSSPPSSSAASSSSASSIRSSSSSASSIRSSSSLSSLSASSASSASTAANEGDAVAGKAKFTELCVACHQHQGNGVFTALGQRFDVDEVLAAVGFDGLVQVIDAQMPPFGKEMSCIDDCALNTAAYLKTFASDTVASSSAQSSSVSSSSSSVTSSSAASSSQAAEPSVVYAINVGAASDVLLDGQIYTADRFYTMDGSAEGGTSITTRDIIGTAEDALYRSQRYGIFTYQLPVQDGKYNVTLHLAEQWATSAGMRIMSVTAEGVTVIDSIDLYADVGAFTRADILAENITVTDGSLTLRFTAEANLATAAGILVTSSDGGAAEPPVVKSSCAGSDMTICMDFENVTPGTLPAGFDQIGANARVVDGQQAHSGTKSLKFIGASYGDGYLRKNGIEGSHWGRVFYKIKTPTPIANSHSVLHASFVALKTSNYEARVVDTVQANSDKTHQYLYNVQIDGAGEGGKSTSYNWRFENKWVCAEWHLDSTTQTYEFFVDGVRVNQISGPVVYPNSSSIPAQYQWIGFGLRVYQNNAGLEGWMDDIALGATRIGCTI